MYSLVAIGFLKCGNGNILYLCSHAFLLYVHCCCCF